MREHPGLPGRPAGGSTRGRRRPCWRNQRAMPQGIPRGLRRAPRRSGLAPCPRQSEGRGPGCPTDQKPRPFVHGRLRRCPMPSTSSEGIVAQSATVAAGRTPLAAITSRSRRSRASSARSSSSSTPVPSPPRRISASTQLPSVTAGSQIPGHLRNRLTSLPDQPHRALPEVPVELPARLCHRPPP